MKLEDIINDLIYQTIQATKYGSDDDIANIHTKAYNRLTGYNDQGEFIGLPNPLPAQYLMGLNTEDERDV